MTLAFRCAQVVLMSPLVVAAWQSNAQVATSTDGTRIVARSDGDRARWARGDVPVSLAWLSAMLTYPAIELRDMRPPTLWLVGTANATAMASVKAYEGRLTGTRVTVALLDGLTHQQELDTIDQSPPKALEFTREHQ